jgi:hypothetical protein
VVCTAVFLLAFAAAGFAQAPIPFTVAEFDPPAVNRFGLYGLGVGPGRAAQSFTPTRDGKLDAIRVLLQENGPVPTGVIVEVRSVNPQTGLPTDEVLASAMAPTSGLTSTAGYFTANFSSSNVVLRQGVQYAFVLRLFESGVGTTLVGSLQSGVDPYANGALIRSSDGGSTWNVISPGYYDVGFRVTAVPAVITSPDNSYGTGKLSVDLITGLEWLDLTLTVNESPAQIQAGEGGYLAAGFRLATPPEVQSLWEHFGMTRFGVATVDAQDVAAANAIVDTMGVTFPGTGASEMVGYVANPSSPTSYLRSFVDVFTSSSFCSQFTLSTPCVRAYVGDAPILSSDSNGYTGAFLVRDRGVVDQSFSPFSFIGGDISVSGYLIGGSLQQSVAQTFTVGQTGTLSRVAVQVGGFGAVSRPVTLEVRPTTSGVPSGGSALASATISASTILTASPTNAFIVVDLNAPIQVSAGTVLAIVLTSDEPLDRYGWQASTSFATPAPRLYPGGVGLFRNNDNPNWRPSATTDYGFRTYVAPSSGGDVTAPQLTLPAPMTVPATGASGAVVAFTVSATDDVDPSPQVSCTPSSGSTFALGTTTVACVSTDTSGNTAQGSFTVRVIDADAPTLSGIPSPITREASSPNGAVAVWSPLTAVDNVDGAVPVTCSPQSGSTFPLGPTTVTCGATDAAGNSTSVMFSVTVRDTTAPSVFILNPVQDSVITATPATVTLSVSDLVGVATVTINGVSAVMTAGTPQLGTWVAQVPVTPFGAVLTFSATARDAALNGAIASVIVDNDGIAAAIDRTAAGADQTTAYNTSFTDGVTQGFLGSRTPNTPVTAVKLANGRIRLEVLGASTTFAQINLCGGSKYVQLNGGESADVNCSGSTVTVTAVTTPLYVDLFKQMTTVYYQSYSYYVTTYYDCGTFFHPATCWYNTWYTYTYPVIYTYWSQSLLRAGQTLSTGSPVTAAADNSEPIEVRILRRYNDDGVDAVVASLELDPNESLDPTIVPGATEAEPELIHINMISGAASINVLGQTYAIGTGQETNFSTAPPRAQQSITFDPLPNRSYGDAPFDLTATSTSGLQVTFTASGACTVSGVRVTLTGVRDCTITASQTGNASYEAASSVSRTFSVFHSWTGILQPVNANNTSVFKLGSTVPVKFSLTGGSAGVTTLAAKLYVAKVGSAVVGTELEGTSTAASDGGNVFRYDAAAGQYIFNWGTKGLSEGTWQIRVDLLDGKGDRTVLVSLKK